MDAKTTALVAALKEAMSRPEEQPLCKAGKLPGLFASRTGDPGEAASQAVKDGLLEVVRTETKGKTTTEWVRITPRGVQFVYQHESPRAVLEELVQLLRVNPDGVPRWAEELRAQLQGLINRYHDVLDRQQALLNHLRQRAEEALRKLEAPPSGESTLGAWQLDALAYLDRRRAAAGAAECLLPELFNALRGQHDALDLASFHAGLAELRERGAIELLPFEGHLSDLAEPEFALLEGAAVFYGVRRT
jgi:hypothetical protein